MVVDYKETDNVKVKEEINYENINDDEEAKCIFIAFIIVFTIIFIAFFLNIIDVYILYL